MAPGQGLEGEPPLSLFSAPSRAICRCGCLLAHVDPSSYTANSEAALARKDWPALHHVSLRLCPTYPIKVSGWPIVGQMALPSVPPGPVHLSQAVTFSLCGLHISKKTSGAISMRYTVSWANHKCLRGQHRWKLVLL